MTTPCAVRGSGVLALARGLLLCGLLIAAPVLAAQEPALAAEAVDDGPYVLDAGTALEAVWVCDGEVLRQSLARQQPLAPRCGYPYPLTIPAATAQDTPTPYRGGRIIALSDIHGQFDLLLRLLRANGVIDSDSRWAAGDAHLVITGDVFDRGDRVTEAVWLLWQLQAQARQAGGEVHYLLGNHETMVLAGDLRYVNPKYTQVARQLRRSVRGLYARDTVLGAWLHARPVLLKLGNTLFLHGGISPGNLALALDVAATNAAYRASLGVPKDQALTDPSTHRYYEGKQSPIWYRGYFDGQLQTAQIDALVQQLGLARIVVGHTTQRHVSSLHGGRIIAIDSGIKRGESGELLFIERDQLSRGLLDGSRVALPEFPGAPPEED